MYDASALPAALKNVLSASKETPSKSNLPMTDPTTLPPAEQERAMSRAFVGQEFQKFCYGERRGSIEEEKRRFLDLYNSADPRYELARQRLGPVRHWRTFRRWAAKGSENPFALADQRGKHRAGQTTITPEQERIIRTFAYHENRLLDSEIIRASIARMKEEGVPCPRARTPFGAIWCG